MSDKPVNALSPAQHLKGPQPVGNRSAPSKVFEFGGRIAAHSVEHVSSSSDDDDDDGMTYVDYRQDDQDNIEYAGYTQRNIGHNLRESDSSSHSPVSSSPKVSESEDLTNKLTGLGIRHSRTDARQAKFGNNSSKSSGKSGSRSGHSHQDSMTLIKKAQTSLSSASSRNDGAWADDDNDSLPHLSTGKHQNNQSSVTSKDSQHRPPLPELGIIDSSKPFGDMLEEEDPTGTMENMAEKGANASGRNELDKLPLRPARNRYSGRDVTWKGRSRPAMMHPAAADSSNEPDKLQLLPARDRYSGRDVARKGHDRLVLRRPAAPKADGISPKQIKIKTRNRSTPVRWAVIGGGLGAVAFGAAGSAVPVLGTAIGAAGGAFIGAGIGLVVGGIAAGLSGIGKMIAYSHEDHIKAALQLFWGPGRTFTEGEERNLQDSNISRKQWRDLLHVPDTHWWSPDNNGVANKEDRQKIRAALIIAMTKMGGRPEERLAQAHMIKAGLLSAPVKDVRGYSVLDARDLRTFEPHAIQRELEVLGLKDKLKYIGGSLGGPYRNLLSDYRDFDDALKHDDKARLNACIDEGYLKGLIECPDDFDLIDNDLAPYRIGDRNYVPQLAANTGRPRISEEDSRKIRQALILCAAKEGYDAASVVKDQLYNVTDYNVILNEALFEEEEYPVSLPGYAALREPDAFDKLIHGRRDEIKFNVWTHREVKRAVKELIYELSHDGRLNSQHQKFRKYLFEIANVIIRRLSKLDANMPSEEQLHALCEATLIASKWDDRHYREINNIGKDDDWDNQIMRNALRSLLRKPLESQGLKALAEIRSKESIQQLRASDPTSGYRKALAGFLKIRANSLQRTAVVLKEKIGKTVLSDALDRIEGGTEGPKTEALRAKVIALMKERKNGPVRAALLLGFFIERVRQSQARKSEAVSELAADFALNTFIDVDNPSMSDLPSDIGTDVTDSEYS